MVSSIVNPYIAGNPVTGSAMFFGREDVFEFVRRTLTGQHRDNVLVLYGQRRSGKTSVLYQMHRYLDDRYLCVFVDLHGLALEGLGGFLWELANHIVRVLRRDYQVNLPRMDRSAFLADPRASFENEFLNSLWSIIGERHLLLMLDEAVRLQEQVLAGKLEPHIFEYVRHLMQHHERLNFLFALGSGLEEMEKDYAFLFNVGLYKKISFLERTDAYALITQPVKGHYQVEQAALERIFQVTSGHPYYTQLVCHCLFNRWQQRPRARVVAEDVDEILDEVVERGLAVLKHAWEESHAGEKAFLAGMATAMDEGNSPVAVKAIARSWRQYDVIIPRGETARAIQSLIARDLIVGRESYRFTVDLLRLWVQRYRRLAWVKEEIADAVQAWAPDSRHGPTIKFSRRTVLVSMIGLAAVGSGIAWWLRNVPLSSRSSTSHPHLPYTYRGHSLQVTAVAWSPDGTRLASGSKDGTVQIWDAADGRHAYTYPGHSGAVTAVAWSPDGTRIASGSVDGTVQVWDEADGSRPYTYPGHSGAVTAVAWSPDGKYIASGGYDKTVQVWDVAGRDHVFTYSGHSLQVDGVAWSPNGKYLASASFDGTVQVWDAADGRNIFTYHGHADAVWSVTWSPSGTHLASASSDGTVQVWNATNGDHAYIYHGHTDKVLAVAWSPNGKYLASGSVDGTVQVWDAADGGHAFTYHGHFDVVHAVAWSPGSIRIASGSKDSTVQVWNAADGGHAFTYHGHTNVVNAVAWSLDGTHLASASVDETVQVWNAADGRHAFTYHGHTNVVNAVAWSPDNVHLASGSADKTVQVWNAADGRHTYIYRGHTDAVNAVAWSPDGMRIASGSTDKTVQVWEIG